MLADWLMEVTLTAGRWFVPGYGAAPPDWTEPVDLSSSEAATAWIQAEADNWFGAVRIAAAQGWDPQIVDTAEALHWFSDHWQLWVHWHELFTLAAASAERMGDAVAHATHLNYLSWAQEIRKEYKQAVETALRAVDIAEQAGDLRQQAWGYHYAAHSTVRQDPAVALPHAQQAERLFAQAGDYEGHLQVLQTVAFCLLHLGQPQEAIEKLQESVELARIPQTGEARQLMADVAVFAGTRHLALAYEMVGEDETAEDSYRQALTGVAKANFPFPYAETEVRFARLLHRRGRLDEARAMLREGRERFAALDAAAQVAEADELLELWRGGG